MLRDQGAAKQTWLLCRVPPQEPHTLPVVTHGNTHPNAISILSVRLVQSRPSMELTVASSSNPSQAASMLASMLLQHWHHFIHCFSLSKDKTALNLFSLSEGNPHLGGIRKRPELLPQS